MRRLLTVLTLSATICASTAAFSADWPGFRGPQANGIAPDTGINKSWGTKAPKLLWKVPLSDDGYAGPSVAGGKVFIIDHQEKNDIVRAFDFSTGKEVWKFSYADTDKANYGFARSTPVIDQGKVFTLSRLGMLYCLDAKTGKSVWSKDIVKEYGGKRPQWDYAVSPLVDKNKLIILPGGPDAAIAALDKRTGKTLWTGGGSETPGYATPVLATITGIPQYVFFTADNLVGADASTGKKLWSYEWKTSYGVNATAPIVIGDSVFITTGYNHGCALVDITASGAKTKWQNKEMQAQFSSPILVNGFIYGTGDPGYLMCLDAQTGKSLWKQEGFEKGAIVVADGTIIAANGAEGDIVMVNLASDAYKELGRINPLGGQTWTAPIIADGKLIVRNKSSLACLSLK